MRRCSPLVLTLIALVPSATAPADARSCACTSFRTFEQALDRSDAIFLGEVLAVPGAQPGYPQAVWAVVRVDAAWRGAHPRPSAC